MSSQNYFFPILVFIIFISGDLLGQKNNSIKINLLSPLVKNLHVSYERSVTDSLAIQMGLQYMNLEFAGAEYNGYSIIPEVRIYKFKSGKFEPYVAPFGKYHYADIELASEGSNGNYSVAKASYIRFGGGIIFGCKYIFKNIAVAEIYLGPSYTKGKFDSRSNELVHFSHFNIATSFFSGISIRSGILIGIRF